MLEAAQYSENSFVTLTYDDEHLPDGGNLVPRDLQLFLKRLRKAVAPFRIRYYAVGEYGDETGRPHYHLGLFGFGTCLFGVSRYNAYRKNCCTRCDLVRDAWGLGNVSLGTLEAASAAYVAGYVTKKMTAKDDPRLNGRHPEFARMSLKPGIGGDAMHEIASVLMHYALEETEVDVPNALRHGSKLYPLGRYLRQRLRRMVGKDEKCPEAVVKALQAELRPMLEASEIAVPKGVSSVAHDLRKAYFGQKVVDANAGKVARAEALEKIYRKRASV